MMAMRLLLLAMAMSAAAYAQADGESVKWETTCSARGCLLQTEVLRGDSGDPPDPSDFHEYVSIDVAFDRGTRKPAYFAFHVDPNTEQKQGISIGFTKAGKDGVDSDGTSRLDVSDCDDKSCVARVPLGAVKNSEHSRGLNLLDKFLKGDRLLVSYTRGGKEYRTVVPLASFQQEYPRITAQFDAKK
jgi:hypothetical protein